MAEAAKLAESVQLDGGWIALDHDHWADDPQPPYVPAHLESFRLEDSVPVWSWMFGDTRLEKRIWMEQGENTTYVQYRLAWLQSTSFTWRVWRMLPLVSHQEGAPRRSRRGPAPR